MRAQAVSWKREKTRRSVYVDTQVDVDLSEFNEVQLLQGLVDADWLTENEAADIKERAEKKAKTPLKIAGLPGETFDEAEMLTAFDYIQRGAREEAILHLSRALGRDWYGVLS